MSRRRAAPKPTRAPTVGSERRECWDGRTRAALPPLARVSMTAEPWAGRALLRGLVALLTIGFVLRPEQSGVCACRAVDPNDDPIGRASAC